MQPQLTVIGGGAVAAATALAALQQGLSVRRLASAPPASVGSRCYALSRRSIAFLRALGITVKNLPVRRFALYAGKTRLLLEDGDNPLCYMVKEEALMQALDARCQEQGLGVAEYENIAHDYTDEEALHFTVDGKAQSTALLAVADGARSLWAQQTGLYAHSVDFNQQAVVATLRIPRQPPEAMQWFDDKDIVALLPLGEGVFSLVWSTAAPPLQQQLAEELMRRTGLQDIALCADSTHYFPLRASTRCARVAPRTALLGDAAGVIHPLAGQGLNLGLADAETLVRCVHRRVSQAPELGLAAYSRVRSMRHQQLQWITKFLLPRQNRAAMLFAAARFSRLRKLAIWFANA